MEPMIQKMIDEEADEQLLLKKEEERLLAEQIETERIEILEKEIRECQEKKTDHVHQDQKVS